MVTIDLREGHEGSCAEFLESWQAWANVSFKHVRPAMIDTHADYQQLIGSKSRNIIRRAKKRGYVFNYFDFNNHLTEMEEINRSMPERGRIPMSGSYLAPVRPISRRPSECFRHRTVYIGAKKEGHLAAYCYLTFCGELAIINRILGHGDALRDGVMYGLMEALVTACRARPVRWLNYLTLESRTEGLTRFKQNIGFRPLDAEFVS